MSVTIDDIEALRRVLTELPRHQPREVSKQEAIALLSTELGAARRRGYTPDELSRILSERGVAINAPTLRSYLRQNRKRRKSHASKKANEQGNDSAASAQSGTAERMTPATPPPSTSPPSPPKGNASSEAAQTDRPPTTAHASGTPGARSIPQVGGPAGTPPPRR